MLPNDDIIDEDEDDEININYINEKKLDDKQNKNTNNKQSNNNNNGIVIEPIIKQSNQNNNSNIKTIILNQKNKNGNSRVRDAIKSPLFWAYTLIVYIYYYLINGIYYRRSNNNNNKFITGNSNGGGNAIQYFPSSNGDGISRMAIPSISLSGQYLKTLIVFINPVSGNRKGVEIFNMVKHQFESRGYSLIVYETKYKNDAFGLSSQLSQKDCDGIVCIGGDGLINEVVNGLLNRDDSSISRHIPIGVIPAGTKNGFANSIGITSIDQAVDIILKSQINYIDVMSVSSIKNHNQYIYPSRKETINNSNNVNSTTVSVGEADKQNNNFFKIQPPMFFENNNQNIDITIMNQNNFKELNNSIDVNSNNNNNNYNNYNSFNNNNGYGDVRRIYSILYVGWGVISYRDKVQDNIRWSKFFKPYISSLYSLFITLPLKQFNSILYYSPSQYHPFSPPLPPTPLPAQLQQQQDNNNIDEMKKMNETRLEYSTCLKKDCKGCKTQYKQVQGGKKSMHDITDWTSIYGSTQDNPNGLTFFAAGNCSHISKDFNLFPCSHLSDGFIDLVISTQNDKSKLLPWVFNESPLSFLLNNQKKKNQKVTTTNTTTPINNDNNNNIIDNNNNEINLVNNNDYGKTITTTSTPTASSLSTTVMNDSSIQYCKTKEFMFKILNNDIPLTIDGELIDFHSTFGLPCDTIKVESQRSMCAFFL